MNDCHFIKMNGILVCRQEYDKNSILLLRCFASLVNMQQNEI